MFFELKNILTQALIKHCFSMLLNNVNVNASDTGSLTKHWKTVNSSEKYFRDHVAMVVVDKVVYCEDVDR
jgi:hydroxymethylpyrimidine/phosphomethylpyrimidine kinase